MDGMQDAGGEQTDQPFSYMEVDSPQTLRAGSLRIGNEDTEALPYERSKYFQPGLDSLTVKGVREGERSFVDPPSDSSSTWGRIEHDGDKTLRKPEIIDLTLESDGDGDGDGDVMESIEVDVNEDEEKEKEGGEEEEEEEENDDFLYSYPTSNTGDADTPVAPLYGNLTDNSLQSTLRFSQLIQPQPSKNHQKDTHNNSESSENRAAGFSQFPQITERLWDRLDIVKPLDATRVRPRREYNP